MPVVISVYPSVGSVLTQRLPISEPTSVWPPHPNNHSYLQSALEHPANAPFHIPFYC